jgi:SAM-dependent methyltransferase
MNHVNLSAYDGVENLDTFSAESFQAYCLAKLAACDDYVRFIRQNCVGSTWEGKVAEIGSGNGKLLYRLEQEGLLRQGVGYEVSPSRHAFAKKFMDFVHSERVTNRNQNVLDAPPLKEFDLIIGVDLVLQLITPLYPNAQTEILRWIHRSLKTGGRLLLQLMDLSHILKLIGLTDDGIYYWWERFPDYDPWEFALVQFALDDQRDLIWDKLFLKRDSAERSHFTNILRNYSPEAMARLLAGSGFSARVFFGESGVHLEQGEYLVLAKKVL